MLYTAPGGDPGGRDDYRSQGRERGRERKDAAKEKQKEMRKNDVGAILKDIEANSDVEVVEINEREANVEET